MRTLRDIAMKLTGWLITGVCILMIANWIVLYLMAFQTVRLYP